MPLDDHEECFECMGTGMTLVPKLYPSGHHEEITECAACDGHGYFFPDNPHWVATTEVDEPRSGDEIMDITRSMF